MEVVRAAGLEIAYDRVGRGSPLVLVHGAGEDARIWQPQLEALEDGLTVIAWDEPGAGRSSDVPADFGLEDYAGCLATLIRAVALGPAHVAGLSWGGTVALELYRHHPEIVAALILVDTYAGWRGSLPEEEVRARVEGVLQMLAAPTDEFDPTFPGLFAGDPPARFVPLLTRIAADVRPGSLRKELFVMAETDQRDLLARVAVPTLLIWGELDARSPLSVARQFERGIADAQLVVIRSRSHQQPRAARAVQRGGPHVLPCPSTRVSTRAGKTTVNTSLSFRQRRPAAYFPLHTRASEAPEQRSAPGPAVGPLRR